MAIDRYSIYRQYIEEQRAEYERAIIEIHEIVQKLRDGIIINGKKIKIKDAVKVEGRIKAFDSAFKNDRTEKKKLDDCFGIRVVTENKLSAIVIKEIIRRLNNSDIRKALCMADGADYNVEEEKNHAKREGTEYNAVHQIITRSTENEMSPLIEIQYWDKELEERCTYGDLSHGGYKKEKLKEVMNGMIGKELPEYYDFDGNGKLKILSKEEAIKKMFPKEEEKER